MIASRVAIRKPPINTKEKKFTRPNTKDFISDFTFNTL